MKSLSRTTVEWVVRSREKFGDQKVGGQNHRTPEARILGSKEYGEISGRNRWARKTPILN